MIRVNVLKMNIHRGYTKAKVEVSMENDGGIFGKEVFTLSVDHIGKETITVSEEGSTECYPWINDNIETAIITAAVAAYNDNLDR